MKLTLLIFFLLSSCLFCMPSSADTLYRMDEKGIYYLSQDTVYTELWQLPAPGAPPPESIKWPK